MIPVRWLPPLVLSCLIPLAVEPWATLGGGAPWHHSTTTFSPVGWGERWARAGRSANRLDSWTTERTPG